MWGLLSDIFAIDLGSIRKMVPGTCDKNSEKGPLPSLEIQVTQ